MSDRPQKQPTGQTDRITYGANMYIRTYISEVLVNLHIYIQCVCILDYQIVVKSVNGH